VISKQTIVWFVLLLLSSAALWLHTYQEGKPCREWKKTHLNASTTAGTEDGAEASFTPCDLMWKPLPLRNTGILRFAQNDDIRLTTTEAMAL
jgi:hypothetical protein